MVKPRGRDGEVVAVPASGLPPVLREGLEVAVAPPELRGPRWRTVREAEGDARGQLVRLSGVNDLAAAERIRGKRLLARVADLPGDLALHDAGALVGREVRDAALGSVGTIAEVMFGPANDVWAVEGPFGEVLVPVVDEVVSEVPDSGAIEVSLPAGSVAGGEGA